MMGSCDDNLASTPLLSERVGLRLANGSRVTARPSATKYHADFCITFINATYSCPARLSGGKVGTSGVTG